VLFVYSVLMYFTQFIILSDTKAGLVLVTVVLNFEKHQNNIKNAVLCFAGVVKYSHSVCMKETHPPPAKLV